MSKFGLRNTLAIALILLSLGLLYPGLTQPILNIYVGAALPVLGELELYNQTQSIWGSIQSLFASGHTLVAWLILLFSVLVPIFKALSLVLVYFISHKVLGKRLYYVVSLISKWSMADVFVVSIFMAYLAGEANQNIQASLHDGFYYFAAYCMISILGTQLFQLHNKNSVKGDGDEKS